jgi:hypothetical protein
MIKLKMLGPKVRGFVVDCVAIIGGAAIWHGVDMVYRPAGWVLAGAAMVGAAWLLDRRDV